MAFEAYLQQQQLLRPATRGRRITYTVSVLLHGAAVIVAIAYSFWHIEEISPRAVTVTFIAVGAAPPPPPVPAPLGNESAPAKAKIPTARPKAASTAATPSRPPDVVQPKAPAEHPIVVAPKEQPLQVAPAGTGTTAAVQAKVATGAGDGRLTGPVESSGGKNESGSSAGTGNRSAPAAQFLPPQIGAQQKLSGAEPEFPASLRTAGASYVVMAKICVETSGNVGAINLMKRAHPMLDMNVAAAVKGWRFRPLLANGHPVPFCYFGRFEFKSE